ALDAGTPLRVVGDGKRAVALPGRPPPAGRGARRDPDAAVGHYPAAPGDPHHRHAHRPAAHQTARPIAAQHPRGALTGAVARLHGRARPAAGRSGKERQTLVARCSLLVAIGNESLATSNWQLATMNWFRGKRGGLIAFLLIAGLVAGGLGWVTATVLRLEHEQLEARADAEHAAQ